jgi:pimeloyl-ACP methyl ester carboxylesterase
MLIFSRLIFKSGVFPLLTFLLSLSACNPITLAARDPADTLREFRQDIISSDTLSPFSLQAVKAAGLSQKSVIEDGVSDEDKKLFEDFASTVAKVYISSEVAIGRAQRLEKSNPKRAVGLFLYAAELSWTGMFLPDCSMPVDLRCDSFKVFYDRAVRGVVSYLKSNYWKTDSREAIIGVGARKYTVHLDEGENVEAANEYDSLEVASSVSLEGLSNRYRTQGIGVPVTGCRRRRDSSPQEQYLPKFGTCIPLTAILKFNSESCTGDFCEVKLELLNSYGTGSIQHAGKTVPLAADLTAPFARVIEKTGMGGWDGLFGALSGGDDILMNTGFYTLEPYNSGKIPLITVHGLFSNPLTWVDVHNELMGDAEIRARYQIWHYLYPTNLPILENARTFRDKLDELQGYLAKTSGGTTPQMVVVAHSMGGILTRTAVVTSSDPLRKYLFDNPDFLDGFPAEERSQIAPYVTFSRKPFISRVIFISVPHRGSDIADSWIGRLGKALISMPSNLLRTTESIAKGLRNIIKPSLKSEFDFDNPTSISSLSQKNPTLIALSQTPIHPDVRFHSIIGDRGRGDTPDSSDGVVAYRSSHLDGAESELIVPADHTAHAHPRAVLEVRRILRLHAVNTTNAR